MTCDKCDYRYFRVVGTVNTAQGCRPDMQYLVNWGLRTGVLDEYPQCILRRKRCCRCGTVIRTQEYKVATETKRRKTKFGGTQLAVTLINREET